jgi:hypothetical protein
MTEGLLEAVFSSAEQPGCAADWSCSSGAKVKSGEAVHHYCPIFLHGNDA